MNILMTGATGRVGRALGKELCARGYNIWVVSRSRKKALEHLPFQCQVIEGDLSKMPMVFDFSPDVVIHLMGESIDGRWTIEKKQSIEESRIRATENLCASLKDWSGRFLTVSAVGVYGDRSSEELTEESSAGSGYLANVCRQWERASESLSANVRRVIFRLGVVLDPYEGALQKMIFPFKTGMGGALGNGAQYMSWVHIHDVVKAFLFAVDHESMSGVYNLVSPQPVSNGEFSKAIAHRLRRPAAFSVPAFGLKSLLGEMSSLILDSARVFPNKLLRTGFQFSFPSLEEALNQLLKDQEGVQEVFYTEQFVPHAREKVFRFFGEAENLSLITPKTLNFSIRRVSTASIQKGTLIDYRLKVHGVPLKWRTLIDEWVPHSHFVDLQLEGPYKSWRHSHDFQSVRGGTLMTDRVCYQLPLSYLGWLGGIHFVKNDVEKIFSYRRKVIAELNF